MNEKISQKLDEIEAEMKKVGLWLDITADLQAKLDAGEVKSFLDVPDFAVWLRFIFLPQAKHACKANRFPADSQVGLMAARQYAYHSNMVEAQRLICLLGEFDQLVVACNHAQPKSKQ